MKIRVLLRMSELYAQVAVLTNFLFKIQTIIKKFNPPQRPSEKLIPCF